MKAAAAISPSWMRLGRPCRTRSTSRKINSCTATVNLSGRPAGDARPLTVEVVGSTGLRFGITGTMTDSTLSLLRAPNINATITVKDRGVVVGQVTNRALCGNPIALPVVLAALPRPVGWGYTLLAVMIGWVFFRADSMSGALSMLQAMAGLGAGQPTPFAASWYLTPELVLAMIAGIIGSTPIVPALSRAALRPAASGPIGPPIAWQAGVVLAVVVLLAASITQVALGAFTPFIYFRF